MIAVVAAEEALEAGVALVPPLQRVPGEFTKGGLVKGGLAIRHVFNLHLTSGSNASQLPKGNA